MRITPIEPPENISYSSIGDESVVKPGPFDSLVAKLLPRRWNFLQYLGFFSGLWIISFTIFVLPSIIKLFD